MTIDLKKRIGTMELAAIQSWSAAEARSWLKRNGEPRRDGRGYFIRAGNLLRYFPELRDDSSLLHERIGLAGDMDRLTQRIQAAELRVSKLEAAVNTARARRRRMEQRFRRLIKELRAEKDAAKSKNEAHV